LTFPVQFVDTVGEAEVATINMNPAYLIGASDGIPVRHPNSKITCLEPLDSKDYPYISSVSIGTLGSPKCYGSLRT